MSIVIEISQYNTDNICILVGAILVASVGFSGKLFGGLARVVHVGRRPEGGALASDKVCVPSKGFTFKFGRRS